MTKFTDSAQSKQIDQHEHNIEAAAKRVAIRVFDATTGDWLSVSGRQLSEALSGTDIAITTNAVIHGRTTAGGGTFVDVKVSPSGALQVEGDVTTTETTFATRIDDTSTANTVYIGKASIGSSVSSAVWQIAKLDTSSGLDKTWADGDALFNNVWDDRTSLTYS